MKVSELVQKLQALPQDRDVICQVVDTKGGAWNMYFEFNVIGNSDWLVQLRVSHPDFPDFRELSDYPFDLEPREIE